MPMRLRQRLRRCLACYGRWWRPWDPGARLIESSQLASGELHSGSVVDQLTVRVPGKAMLIGEYAVLDGSDAVVAAVDSYALSFAASGAAATSPFVQAALREAASALLRLGRSLSKSDHVQVEVDTSAFSHEGQSWAWDRRCGDGIDGRLLLRLGWFGRRNLRGTDADRRDRTARP